jgi:hypothetical protein
MHRSGTSAVAGTAIRLGLAPPRTMLPPSDDNPAGFYESPLVCGLNHLVLRAAGCNWDDCLSFDLNRLSGAARTDALDMSLAVLREEFTDAPSFLMKDPRLCLTLPVWLPALAASGAALSILLVVRHPREVARSLLLRDRLPTYTTTLLWLHHCLEAERATRSLPRAVVFYDDLLDDWRSCMTRAGHAARIAWPVRDQTDIGTFLKWSLRHHVAPECPELIVSSRMRGMMDAAWLALRELRDAPEASSARETLDQVHAAFAPWRDAPPSMGVEGIDRWHLAAGLAG